MPAVVPTVRRTDLLLVALLAAALVAAVRAEPRAALAGLVAAVLWTVLLIRLAGRGLEWLSDRGYDADAVGLGAAALLGTVSAAGMATDGSASGLGLVALAVLAPVTTAFAIRQR